MNPSNQTNQNPFQAETQSSNQPADSLATTVVDNIPVHNPNAATNPIATNEDTELDQIMGEVGNEMKNTNQKPEKHHFWFGRHDKAKDAKFSAQPQPVLDIQPVTQQTMSPPPAPPVQPAANQMAASKGQSEVVNQQVTPSKQKSSVPIFAILAAIFITSGLVAAAVFAYKK